jgi:hypothetical protein
MVCFVPLLYRVFVALHGYAHPKIGDSGTLRLLVVIGSLCFRLFASLRFALLD